MAKDKHQQTEAADTPNSAANDSFDFRSGEPDAKLDPLAWQIYRALSRQHRLASDAEREKYPHPDGTVMTAADVEARGISLDHPVVSASCCA
jgi:hypothetical protein